MRWAAHWSWKLQDRNKNTIADEPSHKKAWKQRRKRKRGKSGLTRSYSSLLNKRIDTFIVRLSIFKIYSKLIVVNFETLKTAKQQSWKEIFVEIVKKRLEKFWNLKWGLYFWFLKFRLSKQCHVYFSHLFCLFHPMLLVNLQCPYFILVA